MRIELHMLSERHNMCLPAFKFKTSSQILFVLILFCHAKHRSHGITKRPPIRSFSPAHPKPAVTCSRCPYDLSRKFWVYPRVSSQLSLKTSNGRQPGGILIRSQNHLSWLLYAPSGCSSSSPGLSG